MTDTNYNLNRKAIILINRFILDGRNIILPLTLNKTVGNYFIYYFKASKLKEFQEFIDNSLL